MEDVACKMLQAQNASMTTGKKLGLEKWGQIVFHSKWLFLREDINGNFTSCTQSGTLLVVLPVDHFPVVFLQGAQNAVEGASRAIRSSEMRLGDFAL